jgi:ApaG protein
MYNRTTRNIRIHVQPQFLEGQSRPDEARFVWAYTITVENQGAEIVTLLSRYWKITDAFGRIQEVRGENFQYTSGCPLSTPNGFMVGSYHMKNQHGETFEVEVPAFSLDSPYGEHSVN